MATVAISLVILTSSLILSSVAGGGIYSVSNGYWMPQSAPYSLQFSKTLDTKMLGVPALIKYQDITEKECMTRCAKNKACLSATYAAKNLNCNLYALNTSVDPKASSNGWPKVTLYEKRHFWSKFADPKPGKLDDIAGAAIKKKLDTVRKCANECILQNKNPECKAFNYNKDTQSCELLASALKGNEYAYDENKPGQVYDMAAYTLDTRNQIPEPETTETFLTKQTSIYWLIISLLVMYSLKMHYI